MITVITACEPVRDDEYNLNGEAPKPSIEVTAIDGNTFIVKDNTPAVSKDFGHSPGDFLPTQRQQWIPFFIPKKAVIP